MKNQIKLTKRPKIYQLFNYLFVEHPIFFTFQIICTLGCFIQLLSVITEFMRFNTVVEIEIDSADYTFVPAITISNDFFMFLNQTKINEEFKEWRNLSVLGKTRNFLSLQNITSSFKFQFLYDRNILFENCTVYDIYSTNVSKQEIEDYEKLSEEFKTEAVNKEEFSTINLNVTKFNPPYVQTRKCSEIADVYLRTEYKDLTGWSDHLWYLTLFYRPADKINENKYKFTKMGNELLLSLKWEMLVTEDIEFGFKIHFHAADMSPNSKRAATLGINGRAYRWITLGYSHSVGHFLKPPYRSNCYDYTDYNFTSRQDCIDTCKIELTKTHCNTLPLYTLMETEKTADFINRKDNVECFYRFNIGLFCEQKCYRKDCSADFYTASILSEVSQSKRTLVIDIVKPNTGVNEEFNYKQSMKPFELFLYVGSTLSLWFGISVYGFEKYFKIFKKYCLVQRSKSKILKRAKRMFDNRVKSSRRLGNNKTMDNNLLNYRTVNVLSEKSVNVLDKLQKHDEKQKFKDRLGFNYNQNLDFKYKNNLNYYDNQMMNDNQIKFIIVDKRLE